MRCDRCKQTIKKGDEIQIHGQTLCEDCYMDQLSPPRMCDPWAVYTAKSFAGQSSDGEILTETQRKILKLLEETGGIELDRLVEQLGISLPDLERELAALRHMEKIRASLRDGIKIYVRW